MPHKRGDEKHHHHNQLCLATPEKNPGRAQQDHESAAHQSALQKKKKRFRYVLAARSAGFGLIRTGADPRPRHPRNHDDLWS